MSKDFESHPTKSKCHRWHPAAWLRVSGEDAASFLQGQFTQDMRRLDRESAVYGLWLNHKGRVIADSFIAKDGKGGFWVGSYFSPAAVIKERLEAFVIADDVVIDDETDQWRGMTILVEDATEALPAGSGVVSFPGRRAVSSSQEWVFPQTEERAFDDPVLKGVELSPQQMELLRIEAKIPAIPADIGSGELPNEGGLEASAISYTKGCYLGQEVMARLKSMGQVRRRLIKLTGEGERPKPPALLFQGDMRIGEIRTAIETSSGYVGLALVSLLNVKWGQRASVGKGGEPTVTLEALES